MVTKKQKHKRMPVIYFVLIFLIIGLIYFTWLNPNEETYDPEDYIILDVQPQTSLSINRTLSGNLSLQIANKLEGWVLIGVMMVVVMIFIVILLRFLTPLGEI